MAILPAGQRTRHAEHHEPVPEILQRAHTIAAGQPHAARTCMLCPIHIRAAWRGRPMIIRLDHVGVVAHAWGEARDVLVERLGFPLELSRTQMPEGNLYEPQNTRIYFVKVGLGVTLIE